MAAKDKSLKKLIYPISDIKIVSDGNSLRFFSTGWDPQLALIIPPINFKEIYLFFGISIS